MYYISLVPRPQVGLLPTCKLGARLDTSHPMMVTICLSSVHAATCPCWICTKSFSSLEQNTTKQSQTRVQEYFFTVQLSTLLISVLELLYKQFQFFLLFLNHQTLCGLQQVYTLNVIQTSRRLHDLLVIIRYVDA